MPFLTQEQSQVDRQKEKNVVSFTCEQNIICSQTQLDDIVHDQTIICRQLFAGQVWTFGRWKGKKIKSNDKSHWMIKTNSYSLS